MGMLDGETFAINLKSNWCVRYSTRAVYRGWCIKITTSSLVKNQQFLHYIDETWAKWLPHEVITFIKFDNDNAKTVFGEKKDHDLNF